MKYSNSTYSIFLLLGICLSFLLHFKNISQDIQGYHSWRQSQTMWNVRNFVRNDSNILNPRTNSFNGDNDNVFRYEFPIMQWSMAMVLKTFGEKIELVRLLMFLFGALGTVGIYLILCQLFKDKLVALLTAFLFQFSPVFYYYTFTPLPDIFALSTGIWYIYFMLKFRKGITVRYFIYASIFLLLSTLAKLPYLMFGVVSFVFFIELLPKLNPKRLIFYSFIHILILAPAFFWYKWVMPTWTGNPVLTGIFKGDYTLADYIDLLGFHLFEMFPNKLLLFPVWIPFAIGIYFVFKDRKNLKWLWGLIGITLLYLLLQLTVILRVHDYYMLPFIPWLFILVGFGIHYLITKFKYGKYLMPIICLASIWYCLFTTKTWNDLSETYFNKDVFLYASELKEIVPDDELCIILNDVSSYIFSYKIDKMGYVFKDDYLELDWIDDMVRNHGVKYMYSDSQKFNTNYPEFQEYVDKVILERGSVVVYKLKLLTNSED